MSRIRPLFARAAALTIAVVALVPMPAVAETAAPVCKGQDMLAELKTSNPDLYAKVIDESSKLENSDGVLWKVEKDGVAPSYLFGTIHLSDPRLTTLSPKATEALSGSDTVVLELADVSENALGAAVSKATDLIVYTDGRNLKSQLSDDEYKIVEDLVKRTGMPAEFAGVFRPWMVSMLLSMSDCERKQVESGALVLDARVAELAQKKGIPVRGLETAEQQFSALAGVPEDQQLQMLKVGLKYADRADDMMETIVQMYLNRQLGAAMPFQIALASLHGTPASAFDGFKKSLIGDRNAKMRDEALPYLDKGKAFIAVGALHMPGPTGLVALVRNAGFTVTKIE